MIAKMFRFLACGMLVMFFVGCAPTSVLPTVVPTLSPTSVSTFVPTSTSFSTPTLLPATSQPLNFFFPKVEKRCPENREVSVDKLGIDADLRIILSDPNQTGLWSLDTVNPSPQLIQGLPLDKWTSMSINPEGRMLAYTIWNPDHSSSTWVYDLQSEEQHEILNIKYWEGLAPSARWLSNQELLIINVPYQSFPLYVINVHTSDSIDVSDVDREPYNEYQTFYTISGKFYPLYSIGNVGNDYIDFYIYDYSTRQKIQVFPWLQDKIFFYPYGGTNLGLDFYLEKIFMMVEQSYGYDFGVVDASVEVLTQNIPYDALMRRVVTDTYFYELDFSFVVLNPANNSLILSVSYEGYINDDFNSEPQKIEDAFFVLDLEHPVIDPRINYMVFTNYCFATTGYYVNRISPDGKIAVLNSDEDIMLLNLETGYIVHLPNWKFIGWSTK